MNELAQSSPVPARRLDRDGICGWIFQHPDALASHAASRIIEQLRNKPDSVLCLPTGRTPQLTYRKLAEAFQRKEVSFRFATIFNVDEYVGLGRGDVSSFASYMQTNLFDHIDIPAGRTFIPDGKADDPVLEAEAYEKKIEAAGGIDFIMLGVGGNGHIGFNEPGSSPGGTTHVVKLAPETLEANAADLTATFQPSEAITIGMRTIMSAKRLLLLATGEAKRLPVQQLLSQGDPDQWPVACLAKHPDLTVLLDEDATP